MDRQIPTIITSGAPFERGMKLGNAVAPRVAHTIQSYMAMFRAVAGLRREQVLAHAETFLQPIRERTPALLEEMRGIAAGTGRDLREILAINARTELLYGTARAECTAVGAIPPASSDGHVRLGQNWDWHPSLAGALVLWVIRRPDGPSVVTLTEAGMVGKIGANAAGLALCVNLLTSESDHGGPCLPMHVILRHLLDTSRSVDDAVALLAVTPRSTSCNHLLADVEGNLLDVEATPACHAVLRPEDGVLTHANHCRDGRLAPSDRYAGDKPETLVRGARAQTLARAAPLDAAGMRALLTDHEHAPGAICRHEQPDAPSAERAESIASIVFDLTAGTLDLADGPPCGREYRTWKLHDLFGSRANSH